MQAEVGSGVGAGDAQRSAAPGVGARLAERDAKGARVSVIIPHYNDLERLDRCLDALVRQTLVRDSFEIIVADNMSPQGIDDVRRVVNDRAKVIVARERGAGPARNAGVAESQGEVLAFIDSDCLPHAQWLEAGLEGLQDFDFVGGRVDVFVEGGGQPNAAEAFERAFAFDFKTYIQRKGFTGSGNMFCPRSIFDAVGGFRSTVSEDVEWSHRARGLGYRLGYCQNAIVGHPARADWAQLRGKWHRVNRESFALSGRAGFGRVRWVLKALALPASAVAHTPKVLFSGRLESGRERLLALYMLYRLRLWRFQDALHLAVGGGTH